jgi:hypothetical protein
MVSAGTILGFAQRDQEEAQGLVVTQLIFKPGTSCIQV